MNPLLHCYPVEISFLHWHIFFDAIMNAMLYNSGSRYFHTLWFTLQLLFNVDTEMLKSNSFSIPELIKELHMNIANFPVQSRELRQCLWTIQMKKSDKVIAIERLKTLPYFESLVIDQVYSACHVMSSELKLINFNGGSFGIASVLLSIMIFHPLYSCLWQSGSITSVHIRSIKITGIQYWIIYMSILNCFIICVTNANAASPVRH